MPSGALGIFSRLPYPPIQVSTFVVVGSQILIGDRPIGANAVLGAPFEIRFGHAQPHAGKVVGAPIPTSRASRRIARTLILRVATSSNWSTPASCILTTLAF